MYNEAQIRGGVMVDADEKARDVRARRAAVRQGLRLERSRLRDARALDYGTYRLVDARTNAIVAAGSAGQYGLTIDEIERALDELPLTRGKQHP